MSFSCYHLRSRGSGKENPNWNDPLSPVLCTHSFIVSLPSLLSSPWDAVWRIAIVSTGLMCCGHCVYRLRMFLVFSERLETQREALRLAGIISSDDWRCLGEVWLCFFSLSLSKTGFTTFDWHSLNTVKCRGSIYKTFNIFHWGQKFPSSLANYDNCINLCYKAQNPLLRWIYCVHLKHCNPSEQ